MFDELVLTHPGIRKPELPEIIRVGHFKRSAAEVPVVLPVGNMNGLCYEVNSETSAVAIRQLEYIALDLIKQVSPEVLQLTFVDMELDTNFPLLYSLKSPSNIHFIDNRKDLQLELQKLFDTARYISTRCLNTEFADLSKYNEATTFKEPYHFLFLANFPKDCTENEVAIITKFINEGARCGIRVIMTYDRAFFPASHTYNQPYIQRLNELLGEMVCIDCAQKHARLLNFDVPIIQRWFDRYIFKFDTYSYQKLKPYLSTLERTTEKQESEHCNFLSIPIGQFGRDRVFFEMGQKSGVYHGLIAGQSGSGKSTLLNNIITTIAEHYSPDDMRLYLLDYKLGVEFKIYRDHPNVEFLLLDNERLSSAVEALKRLEKEMRRREALFDMDLTIQDIDAYNKKAEEKLPRILIIIDEVQQLFKDYETQRQIAPLIKYIAKQGRSFGIHMLFSSQSYDGCNISSDILAQMSLRIAFTLASGQECRAILGGDNDVPKSLPHYSAVYNTKNGNRDANVVVKMDNFDRNHILPILKEASVRYAKSKPFEKTIITRNTAIEQEVSTDSYRSVNKNKSGKWF